MAKYTIELRKIVDTLTREEVESWFKDWELSDYLTSDEIAVIEERGTFSKDKLARLIVDHYYMREIGYETVALFKHQVKVAMREIMEEKAPLIYSAAIAYDPLVNVDFTETYESDSTNEGSTNNSSSSESNGSGLNVNSDTPQGQITKANILAGNYASSTSANEGSSTASNSSEITSEDAGHNEYTKRVKGNSGVSATAQKMVQQYRENIIMINRDIVKALESQFFGIY